jgi:hypothetical protein
MELAKDGPEMLLVLAEQPSGIPHPHSSGRVPSRYEEHDILPQASRYQA